MGKQKNPALLGVFWAQVVIFLLMLSIFFIPVMGEVFKGIQFLLPFVVFSLLGLALIFLTLKGKVKDRLKKFFLLTGASASGFFAFVVLHNFFYALEVIFQPITPLSFLMGVFHACFFFLAIPVCPIGFLIGSIGSAILLLGKKV
jgi:hypothetical protein